MLVAGCLSFLYAVGSSYDDFVIFCMPMPVFLLDSYIKTATYYLFYHSQTEKSSHPNKLHNNRALPKQPSLPLSPSQINPQLCSSGIIPDPCQSLGNSQRALCYTRNCRK